MIYYLSSSLVTDPSGISVCPSHVGGQIPTIVMTLQTTRTDCGYLCWNLTANCTDYTWYEDTGSCEMYTNTPPTQQLMKPTSNCRSYIVSLLLITQVQTIILFSLIRDVETFELRAIYLYLMP